MIRTKKLDEKKLNFWESIYIVEIVKGLVVTMRHFFINLFFPSRIITVSYPEENLPLIGNAKLKSLHRIKIRKDGSPKCVACMMCATICPSKCIYIDADETENYVEKYPKVFNIDMSKCVMCGLCVEACPEDAISMDTGEIVGGSYDRFRNYKNGGLFLTKNELFRHLPHETISKSGAANRLANKYLEDKND